MNVASLNLCDLLPIDHVTKNPLPGIERLWIIGSPSEKKEKVVQNLLSDTVVLSIDDGRRLIGPKDHIAVYDTNSVELILLGPCPKSYAPSDELATKILGSFTNQLLRLAVEPLLALSFRGGKPSSHLGDERTTISTALFHSTNPRSSIGRTRACNMALLALEEMDQALIGVFERERASCDDFDTARALAFCENALKAFQIAGLERPIRSTAGEVRKLWAHLQEAFPFVQSLDVTPPRRLGYSANLLLGGCLDKSAQTEPKKNGHLQSRGVIGKLARNKLVQSIPAAQPMDDVMVVLFGQPRNLGHCLGSSRLGIEVMLESELFAQLGSAAGHGARGLHCPLIVDAFGANVTNQPSFVRAGEWSLVELEPTRAENFKIQVRVAQPGLDMVTASYNF